MANPIDWLRKGLLAPLRLLLPKNPWLRVLVFALPIVLLLALFGPALDVLLKLLDLVLRVLQPMLETTVGRILLLLVTFTTGSLFAVWLLRSRVDAMRGEAVLGRHLLATARLVGHDKKRSRETFLKVSRYRGPLPTRYPHVVQDATLKLARLALEQDRVDEALGWLTRIVEPGLPKELLRSLLQLRCRALRRQGQVLPQTLAEEVHAAVKQFPEDYHLLTELRELHVDAEDQEQLVATQERLVKVAPRSRHGVERQRLMQSLRTLGERQLDGGDWSACRKTIKRLGQLDQTTGSDGLLLGDLLRRQGDLRGALRAYGATRSPAALERIAALLDEHQGQLEPRELLEACPMQGTMLLVARELARAGESERAERAARMAAEVLGPSATVCTILAEVLGLLGRADQARLLRERSIARLLAPSEPD